MDRMTREDILFDDIATSFGTHSEPVDAFTPYENFPEVCREWKNGKGLRESFRAVKFREIKTLNVRLQFLSSRYVCGPQVDKPIIATGLLNLVDRWIPEY